MEPKSTAQTAREVEELARAAGERVLTGSLSDSSSHIEDRWAAEMGSLLAIRAAKQPWETVVRVLRNPYIIVSFRERYLARTFMPDRRVRSLLSQDDWKDIFADALQEHKLFDGGDISRPEDVAAAYSGFVRRALESKLEARGQGK